MPTIAVTEHTVQSNGHTTGYLAAGPDDGPLVIFVHGWPELSLSWRHQLPVFGGLGFRAIAPDLRGFGRSTRYPKLDDYGQEQVVADMIGLLDGVDGVGRDRAVWVGHDWGSPVVWNIASHHPDRCHAVANLCVPYWTLERGFDGVVDLVNRSVYPIDRYPVGQWDYQLYYLENFDRATAVMDANPYNTAKALFRKGSPAGQGQPSGTAQIRDTGGWLGGLDAAPDVPADHDVVSESDLQIYADALGRNGFFGPNAFYMNHEANAAYAERALNSGRLDLPVLFIGARYDYTCETVTSRLAEPMREHCTNLAEAVLDCGHWMAQEKPFEVNAILASWLTTVNGVWPQTATATGGNT